MHAGYQPPPCSPCTAQSGSAGQLPGGGALAAQAGPGASSPASVPPAAPGAGRPWAAARAQVALVALLAAAQLARAQPPRPGPGFRDFVENLSKVVAAEGSEFFKAPAATVQTGAPPRPPRRAPAAHRPLAVRLCWELQLGCAGSFTWGAASGGRGCLHGSSGRELRG